MIRVFLAFFACIACASASEVRTWTNADGRTVEAALRGFVDGKVILSLSNGDTAEVPLSSLSAADRFHLLKNTNVLLGDAVTEQVIASVNPGGTLAVEKADTWPTRLTAPDKFTQATYLEKQSKPGSQLYETKNFGYTVHAAEPLNTQLMQQVARVFEGTYELLRQCPFGLQAEPVNGKFRAHFYPTHKEYVSAGGPELSGGVYMTERREFLVPFESLGIVLKNGKWSRDDDYNMRTLVHELTHMMMHDLLPVLPKWLIEGSAEYVESITFRYGTFTSDTIHQNVRRGRVEKPMPVEWPIMFRITHWQWQQACFGIPLTPIEPTEPILPKPPKPEVFVGRGGSFTQMVPAENFQREAYRAGLLMTYYFMHLDGDGRGTRLLRYLDACRKEAARYKSYRHDFERYEKDLAEFLQKPGVNTFPDGRYTFPSTLTPPREPAAERPEYADGTICRMHLDVLLDGRDPATLGAEIEAALQKAGIDF